MSAETPTRDTPAANPAFRHDPVALASCRERLVAALDSLAYVGRWANLDQEERASLAHAQTVLRALRDDLAAALPCGHDR